jgi:hypothetical protein
VGYLYDSSYNSFGLHGRYGRISLSGRPKYGIAFKISKYFYEIPISNLSIKCFFECRLPGFRKKQQNNKRLVFPWGGGGYFRLLPISLFKMGIRQFLKYNNAYIFYIHPWEIDPRQPLVKSASKRSRLKHYTNLGKTEEKLKNLLLSFSQCGFVSCRQYLNELRLI